MAKHKAKINQKNNEKVLNKKIIILDTNFLMQPFQFKIDIFSEIKRIMMFPYDLVVFEESLDELADILSKPSGRDKKRAKGTIILIKEKEKAKVLKILKKDKKDSYNYLDDKIVDIASENPKKYLVGTQDKELKQRLKKHGVKTITIRQKKYAIIEE